MLPDKDEVIVAQGVIISEQEAEIDRLRAALEEIEDLSSLAFEPTKNRFFKIGQVVYEALYYNKQMEDEDE